MGISQEWKNVFFAVKTSSAQMATIFHTSFNDRSKIPLSTSLVCRNIGLQLPQLMLTNITSIYFNFQLYLLVCPKKSCRSLYWCFFCQWCMRHNLQLLVPMPGLGRWLALLLPLLLGSWVSSLLSFLPSSQYCFPSLPFTTPSKTEASVSACAWHCLKQGARSHCCWQSRS